MTDDPLADVLRRTARRGTFSHLSLICSNGVFKAAFQGITTSDQRFGESDDPVDAMVKALTGKPQRLPKTKPKTEFDELLG